MTGLDMRPRPALQPAASGHVTVVDGHPTYRDVCAVRVQDSYVFDGYWVLGEVDARCEEPRRRQLKGGKVCRLT